MTIGRRPSNDVVLDWDSEISRVHAALERIGDDWTVVDDGLSHNGTYLNGSRVTSRQRLKDGDVLTVGGVAIAFRAPGGESVSRPTVTAMGPHVGELLTPAQRRVLVALCRPFKDSTYATPATNQQIADELVRQRRRGQEHAAGAVRGLRRRRAAAEPEARVAGAAGPADRRDHPSRPVSDLAHTVLGLARDPQAPSPSTASANGFTAQPRAARRRPARTLRVDRVEVARVVVGDVDEAVSPIASWRGRWPTLIGIDVAGRGRPSCRRRRPPGVATQSAPPR